MRQLPLSASLQGQVTTPRFDDDTNVSVYTVATGAGNTVTIPRSLQRLPGTLVMSGYGCFVETVNSVTVNLGAGADTITVRDGNVGTIDGGADLTQLT